MIDDEKRRRLVLLMCEPDGNCAIRQVPKEERRQNMRRSAMEEIAVPVLIGAFRVVLDTPLGEFVSEWIERNADLVDKSWIDMMERMELSRDIAMAFMDQDKCVDEGIRIYGKWGPVLRMMCVESVCSG